MNETVEIRSSRGTKLLFSDPEITSDSRLNYFTVTFESAAIWATSRISAFNSEQELVDFFSQLAENWRGWDGEKRYQSIDVDFLLSASHDKRAYINLGIILCGRRGDDEGWSIDANLVVDIGQLESIYNSVKNFLKQ